MEINQMQINHGISKLQSSHRMSISNSVVTIGNFDGLHLGHREIISRVVDRAQKLKTPSVVVTFSPHPRKILHPEINHTQLFDQRDQEIELQKMGVTLLNIEPFSRDLSQLLPEQFLNDYIIKPFSPAALIVGYDFAFGANRQGTLAILEGLCKKEDIDLEIVHPYKTEGLVVSSSEIRKCLREGQVELAKKMLGRSFYISGLVEKGDQRGRTLSFPTANISTRFETIPKPGVYATTAVWSGQAFKSVTNIGFNPTFIDKESKSLKIETHILNFDQEIYGEEIQIQFEKFLRNEKKFSTSQELVQQIKMDVQAAIEVLNEVV